MDIETQTEIVAQIKATNPKIPSGERASKDPGCVEFLLGFLEDTKTRTIHVLRNSRIPDTSTHIGGEVYLHLPGTLNIGVNMCLEASGIETVDNDGQALAYLQQVEGHTIVVHDPA